jgi:hypothetical protein
MTPATMQIAPISTIVRAEYNHTKCRELAARFAARFQVACVTAASNTATKAINGIRQQS